MMQRDRPDQKRQLRPWERHRSRDHAGRATRGARGNVLRRPARRALRAHSRHRPWTNCYAAFVGHATRPEKLEPRTLAALVLGRGSSARTIVAKFLLGSRQYGGARLMFQLRRAVQAVREELDFDPRRVASGVCSGILPQNSFNRVRTMLLRRLGLPIGATSLFGGAVHITGSGALSDLLSIGPGCYITGPVHIDLSAPVWIGARVYIGHQVRLLTVDHEIGDSAQRCGPRVYRAIHVEDGVWIGSCAVILPGVR